VIQGFLVLSYLAIQKDHKLITKGYKYPRKKLQKNRKKKKNFNKKLNNYILYLFFLKFLDIIYFVDFEEAKGKKKSLGFIIVVVLSHVCQLAVE